MVKIALLTPDMLHYGMASQVIKERQSLLEQAYVLNPERFVCVRPRHPPLFSAVWINPPTQITATDNLRR
jgi:putative transposase